MAREVMDSYGCLDSGSRASVNSGALWPALTTIVPGNLAVGCNDAVPSVYKEHL